LQIRPIQEKDNESLFHLIQKILKSYGLDKPGTAYFDPELAKLSYYYEEKEPAQYFVLENEQEEIIGGVGIAPFDQGTCELQKLYVSDDYRGQRLGGQLLETAIDYAGKHYESIYLETHSSLKEALGLYEKFGFISLEKPHEKSPHSAMDVWLWKKLGEE